MLDLDLWQEILATIRQNKLRTLLTGFSVAWGIFMLVLMMGSGAGLANGIEYSFRDDAVNSVWIRAGETSIAYKGQRPGRDVDLDNLDYQTLRGGYRDIEHLSGRYYLRGQVQVRYRNETGSFSIRAVHPDHQYIENTTIAQGRFVNALDLQRRRKVAVLGGSVRTALFGAADPLGEHIDINGIPFQVVGLYSDEGSEREEEIIYLPITTAQLAFRGGQHIDQLMFSIEDPSLERSQALVENVRNQLAERHRFSPEDERALFIRNIFEVFQRFVGLNRAIELFVWVVGLGTILAGVVGVSNIMMIVVKERTREIGVRKALGATPGSVIGLVLLEAVFITAVAGYLGLVSGVGLLALLGRFTQDSEIFRNPQIDIGIAVAATLLLIAAGTLAGLVPAWRAARVQPIEALREE